MEAGKKQLAGDTVREATSDEVKDLRNENRELKEVVAFTPPVLASRPRPSMDRSRSDSSC